MDILEKLQKKIIESDWAEKFKEYEEKAQEQGEEKED